MLFVSRSRVREKDVSGSVTAPPKKASCHGRHDSDNMFPAESDNARQNMFGNSIGIVWGGHHFKTDLRQRLKKHRVP